MNSQTSSQSPSASNFLLALIATLLAAVLLVQIGAGTLAVGIIGVMLIVGIIGVAAMAATIRVVVPLGERLAGNSAAPAARLVDKVLYFAFRAVCVIALLVALGLSIYAVRTQYVAWQAGILSEQVLDSIISMRHEESKRGGPSDGLQVTPAESNGRFANVMLEILQRRPYDGALEVHGSGKTAYVTNRLGNNSKVSVAYVGEFNSLEYQFAELSPTVCKTLIGSFAPAELVKQVRVNGTFIKNINSSGVAQQYNPKEWDDVCATSQANSLTLQF